MQRGGVSVAQTVARVLRIFDELHGLLAKVQVLSGQCSPVMEVCFLD